MRCNLDWLSVCPPTGTGVKHLADDLFQTPLDQAQIDFENEGEETYVYAEIPPYARPQFLADIESKRDDLQRTVLLRTTDYGPGRVFRLRGWDGFWKAREFIVDQTRQNCLRCDKDTLSPRRAGSSLCSGRSCISIRRHEPYEFASFVAFKWTNLAI